MCYGGQIDTLAIPYYYECPRRDIYIEERQSSPIFGRIDVPGHISPCPGTLGQVGLAGYTPHCLASRSLEDDGRGGRQGPALNVPPLRSSMEANFSFGCN